MTGRTAAGYAGKARNYVAMPTTTPRLETATIVSREYRPPGFWCVSIRSPEIAEQARPAQFVALDVAGCFAVRLPLGIFGVAGGAFSVLFQEWGERTRRLAHTAVGDAISCIGPLGNEFRLPPRGSKAVIAAGGLGVSPFWLLARELKSHGVDTTIVLGARTSERVVGARDLAVHGFTVVTCTDDGSAGFRGTVADRIATLPQPDIIYACGPPAMLRAICEHATSRGVACQVSMEETFGCSLGTCWGCVVPVRRGCAQGTGYPRAPGEQREHDLARVCADGTVFDAADLMWTT